MRLCLDENIIGPWVAALSGGRWTPGRGRAIGLLGVDNTIKGGALYEDWNGVNLMCHIAGVGNWATRGFLAVMFDYPFNQIGASRLTAPIEEENIRSIRLAEHMGFRLECRLAKATPRGDMLIYRMMRDECKYLGEKYRRGIDCIIKRVDG